MVRVMVRVSIRLWYMDAQMAAESVGAGEQKRLRTQQLPKIKEQQIIENKISI